MGKQTAGDWYGGLPPVERELLCPGAGPAKKPTASQATKATEEGLDHSKVSWQKMPPRHHPEDDPGLGYRGRRA